MLSLWARGPWYFYTAVPLNQKPSRCGPSVSASLSLSKNQKDEWRRAGKGVGETACTDARSVSCVPRTPPPSVFSEEVLYLFDQGGLGVREDAAREDKLQRKYEIVFHRRGLVFLGGGHDDILQLFPFGALKELRLLQDEIEGLLGILGVFQGNFDPLDLLERLDDLVTVYLDFHGVLAAMESLPYNYREYGPSG